MNKSSSFTYAASIIGYGRFGTLWGKILASYFSLKGQVVAVSDLRTISSNLPQGLHQCSLEDALRLSEAIFLCVPISQMQRVLTCIAPMVNPDALVCDTCSVKTLPAHWMQETLPKSLRILATHPLFGPDSFTRDAKYHNTIICSPVRISDTEYQKWLQRFREMNLVPKTLDLVEHDKQAAYTQCLTHMLGRVLSSLKLTKYTVSTCGYEALLEIILQTCSDSSTLFEDMHQYNNYSQEMRHALQRAFTDVIDALDKKS